MCIWGNTCIIDIVICNSNGSDIWLKVKNLAQNGNKYYYSISDNEIHVYVEDYGNGYSLVTGSCSILTSLSEIDYTIVNQRVMELPSDATEATVIS